MPAKSEAQRKFLFATKGKKWVEAHGFDNKGKIPAHKRKKRTVPKPDRHGFY